MEVRREDLHVGDVFRYDENIYCKVVDIAVVIDTLTLEAEPRIIVSIFDNVLGENFGQRTLDENITEVEVVYRG
jgi:hypothetical protein